MDSQKRLNSEVHFVKPNLFIIICNNNFSATFFINCGSTLVFCRTRSLSLERGLIHSDRLPRGRTLSDHAKPASPVTTHIKPPLTPSLTSPLSVMSMNSECTDYLMSAAPVRSNLSSPSRKCKWYSRGHC